MSGAKSVVSLINSTYKSLQFRQFRARSSHAAYLLTARFTSHLPVVFLRDVQWKNCGIRYRHPLDQIVRLFCNADGMI